MCQGFSNFSVFLHHFVLAKLATSSIRVKLRLAETFQVTLEMFSTEVETHKIDADNVPLVSPSYYW